MMNEIRSFRNASWAGCLKSRKPISGGTVSSGGHLLRTRSQTQSCIALSSAESEFYTMLKTAPESIGMVSVQQEFGHEVFIRPMVVPVLLLALREGTVWKHSPSPHWGWLQVQRFRKASFPKKLAGAENCSDLLTKNVSWDLIGKYCTGLTADFQGEGLRKRFNSTCWTGACERREQNSIESRLGRRRRRRRRSRMK